MLVGHDVCLCIRKCMTIYCIWNFGQTHFQCSQDVIFTIKLLVWLCMKVAQLLVVIFSQNKKRCEGLITIFYTLLFPKSIRERKSTFDSLSTIERKFVPQKNLSQPHRDFANTEWQVTWGLSIHLLFITVSVTHVLNTGIMILDD